MLKFLKLSESDRVRLELKNRNRKSAVANDRRIKKIKLKNEALLREAYRTMNSSESESMRVYTRNLLLTVADSAVSISTGENKVGSSSDKPIDLVVSPAKMVSPPKAGKGTNHPKRHLTWLKHRAPIIWMFLHPKVFNKSYERAVSNSCQLTIAINSFLFKRNVVGVHRTTMVNWMKRDRPKWYHHVKALTWRAVKRAFSKEVSSQFTIPDTDTVDVTQYKPSEQAVVYVSSRSLNVSAAKAGALAAQSRRSMRADDGSGKRATMVVMSRTTSTVGCVGRKLMHPEAYALIREYVVRGWHSGDPATRQGCYEELRQKYEKGSGFYLKFLDPLNPTCSSKLAGWLTRHLTMFGYCNRKVSISQKVPTNWREIALDFSFRMRQYFNEKGVTMVLNADQTFINFYHESKYVLAPTGVKRVGGTVAAADEKLGITFMVTCDLNSSKVLPPFLVFTGVSGARLDKQYATWHTQGGDVKHTARVCFQKKHWFDWQITLRYLKFLDEHCPAGEVIGLVWDMAPSHCHSEVKKWLDEKLAEGRMCYFVIPAGMTSILQICDLLLNAPVKSMIKAYYTMWRTAQMRELRRQGLLGHIKLKVNRPALIGWIEDVVRDLNRKELSKRSIEACFTSAGQNPFRHDEEKFVAHLDSLSMSSMYAALTEAAKAVHIQDEEEEAAHQNEIDAEVAKAKALGEDEGIDYEWFDGTAKDTEWAWAEEHDTKCRNCDVEITSDEFGVTAIACNLDTWVWHCACLLPLITAEQAAKDCLFACSPACVVEAEGHIAMHK